MKKRERTPAPGHTAGSGAGNDDAALFREAVRDVEPLGSQGKVTFSRRRPPPIPRKPQEDEAPAPRQFLPDEASLEIEAGDEWIFLRPGVSRQTLRRLRRGYWPVQAQLDLHGFNRDEARLHLAIFLDSNHRQGMRCVRVIHGKGLSSSNHEPILKLRVGSWLSQRDDVLAFCQARPEDGGSGALVVLLRAAAASASATSSEAG